MRRRIRLAVGTALAATGLLLLALSPFEADAQIVPSSTTSTTESASTSTTTTTLLPRTTTTIAPTTSTTAATTSTSAATTTTRPGRTTTTKPGSTTTTFVPPAGVASTTVPSTPAAPLDASTGWLPFFVTLSLGGFAVAIGIITVQWVRSRPRRA